MDSIRWRRFLERARRGEELTIGFIGGSVTQGSLASAQEKTYVYRVYDWWRRTFPEAEFHCVNAGIGGTTSHYGVARAGKDLLMYRPDAVVVDFCVNDEEGDFFRETYEGLIRRILSCPSEPAALLLNNVYYDTGKSAQECHNQVGEHYGIPHVSIRDTVYRRMREGIYAQEELTPDGLHPGDRGHGLVADEIIRFLETERVKASESFVEAGEQMLPDPLTANAYEHAGRLTIENACPVLRGFRADVREKKGHLDAFKNGWTGKHAGDRIVFRVEASCIAVQYRKSVGKPACSARLTLDGDREHPVLLDGNFEESWGDCQYLQSVLHHGAYRTHTVEIEILPGEPEAAEFYLMSLIIA